MVHRDHVAGPQGDQPGRIELEDGNRVVEAGHRRHRDPRYLVEIADAARVDLEAVRRAHGAPPHDLVDGLDGRRGPAVHPRVVGDEYRIDRAVLGPVHRRQAPLLRLAPPRNAHEVVLGDVGDGRVVGGHVGQLVNGNQPVSAGPAHRAEDPQDAVHCVAQPLPLAVREQVVCIEPHPGPSAPPCLDRGHVHKRRGHAARDLGDARVVGGMIGTGGAAVVRTQEQLQEQRRRGLGQRERVGRRSR